jgi:hypothetical protein
VECAFEVNLPDPAGGDRELVPDDGRPIRYQGRVDLLATDERDRSARPARPGGDLQPGRRGVPADPDPRDPVEVAAMGARLAVEALEMVDPRLRPDPSPASEHCGSCRFVAPCLALERGGDVAAALAAGYRDRGPERVEPGRLGSATWGTGRGAAPPRFDAP